MTSIAGDKEEVKRLLRGLLVSSPQTMTVGALRRDYKLQEGHDIPFIKFGFSTVESFLQSLPDVINLEYQSNGQTVVLPVLSQKSAHVDALVMKQRVAKPSGRYVPPPRRRQKLASQFVSQFPNNTRRGTSYYQSNGTTSRPPFVPSVVQKALHNLLLENSQGVSLQVIEQRLCSRFPLEKFAIHGGAEELVRLVPHLAECYNGRVRSNVNYGNDSSNKISYPTNVSVPVNNTSSNSVASSRPSENVSCVNDVGDKPPTSSITNVSCSESPSKRPVQKSTVVSKSFVPSGHESTSVPKVNGIDKAKESTVVTHKPEEVNNIHLRTQTADDYWNNNTFEEETGGKASSSSSSASSSSRKRENSCNNALINNRTVCNLQILLDKYPDGIWCADLPELYKTMFGAPLQFQSLGYVSVVQMVSDLPGVFHLVRQGGEDWLVLDARKELPTCYAAHNIYDPNYDEQHRFATVPKPIMRNIEWLIKFHPNGLPDQELLTFYEDSFLTSLCIQKMGFSTLNGFLRYLEEKSIVELKVTSKATWVFPVVGDTKSDSLPVLPPQEPVKLDSSNAAYPYDVVKPCDEIPVVKIPDWVRPQSTIEVFVGEICSPTRFWVQLRGKQYFGALETLMDDMQTFYLLHAQDFCMPHEVIQLGIYCACVYSCDWHRARIIALQNQSEVKVEYIDYGTRSTVKTVDLRFLFKDFAKLPAQAIRCGLTNLIPAKGRTVWPCAASTRLLELVSDRPLVGIVSSIDAQVNGRWSMSKPLLAMIATFIRQDNSFTAALVDTTSEEDVHINDTLVKEGFAEFKAETVPSTKTETRPMVQSTLKSELSPVADIFIPSPQSQLTSHSTPNLVSYGKPSPSSALTQFTDSPPLTSTDHQALPRPCSVRSQPSQNTTLSSRASRLPPRLQRAVRGNEQPRSVFEPQSVLKSQPAFRPPPGFTAQKRENPLGNHNFLSTANGSSNQVNTEVRKNSISSSMTQLNPEEMKATTRSTTSSESGHSTSLHSSAHESRTSFPHSVNSVETANPVLFPAGRINQNPYEYSLPYPPPMDVITLQQFIYLEQLKQQQQQQMLLMMNSPAVAALFCNPATSYMSSIFNTPVMITTPVPVPQPADQPYPPFTPQVDISEVQGSPPDRSFNCAKKSSTVSNVEPVSQSEDSSKPLLIEQPSSSITEEDVESNSSFVTVMDPCVVESAKETKRENMRCGSDAEVSKTCMNHVKEFTSDTIELFQETLDLNSSECKSTDSIEESSGSSYPIDSDIIFESDDEDNYKSQRQEEVEALHDDHPQQEEDSDADVLVEHEEYASAEEILVASKPHYIKTVDISGRTVHLINLNGEPFLCTDEFVPLFTGFTCRPVVLKILESHNICVPFVEVNRDEYPDLISSLEHVHTEHLKKTSLGTLMGRLHLIPLNYTNQVLNILNIKDLKLHMALRGEIDQFNPEDLYWVGTMS